MRIFNYLISLHVIDLLKFSISSWVSFGNLVLPSNFSISSKMSNLLAKTYSYNFIIIIFSSIELIVMSFLSVLIFIIYVFSLDISGEIFISMFAPLKARISSSSLSLSSTSLMTFFLSQVIVILPFISLNLIFFLVPWMCYNRFFESLWISTSGLVKIIVYINFFSYVCVTHSRFFACLTIVFWKFHHFK